MNSFLPATPFSPQGTGKLYPEVLSTTGAFPHGAMEDSSTAGFIEYWQMLRQHWVIWSSIALAGAICGYLFTLPKTRIYQARASIELQNLTDSSFSLRESSPAASAPASSPEYDIQTQLKILQSDFMIGRVIEHMEQHQQLPLLLATFRGFSWRNSLPREAPETAPGKPDLIAAIGRDLSVRNQANTRVIEVFYDSPSPQAAADVVNAVVSEFIDQNLEARWQSSQHTGEWLTRQLQDLKMKLERSEGQLRSYAQSANLLFTSEKDNVAEDQLRRLQEELSRAQADRVAKQSKYELAMRTSSESLPEVLDDPTLRDHHVKIAELKRALAEMQITYTAANPRIAKLQAQIASLETDLERERTNVVHRIRNEFDAADRRERLLQNYMGEQSKLLSKQADKVAHYNTLRREVDTTRQLYEAMLQRVKEAGIASALRASNSRIIDTAIPPRFPYKPSLRTNVMLGFLSGAVFGAMFIVVRVRSDRTIRKPGDSAIFLNIAELGVIPSAPRARMAPALPRPTLGLLISGPDAPDQDPESALGMVSWNMHLSLLADAFRATLASILYGSPESRRPRVLAVSSANPAEGKTTVISNLGITMAKVKIRVLVLDADLRRPSVHKVFGIENTLGLSDALEGNGPPAVRETRIPNLFVLTSGSKSDPNLLYTGFADLMCQLRRQFDMILIDTPPMLQMPDARIVARHADGIILVVRAQKTTREAAILARQRFSEDGIPLLGIILNDWNPQNGPDAYSRYYRTYHKTYMK